MASDTEQSAQLVNDTPEHDRQVLLEDIEPATPRDDDDSLAPLSQQSLPSTAGPNSPRAGSPFKLEINDVPVDSVIPSSLTPPPSSQVPHIAGAGAVNPLGGCISSLQRSNSILLVSPPATTGLNGILKRDGTDASDFTTPTAQQIAEAPADGLRAMLQACITEHSRLKMETAHHKLQFNLLDLTAREDAQRAAVEHEMTKKEVEALRIAEHSRQARRDLSSASESTQAKYHQLKIWYDQAVEENDILAKKFKAAKKVIQQKEDEILRLRDDQDLLLNRIRENREHFHHLCSPGGMFHGAMTPKTQTAAGTPVQNKSTPRQTPKSVSTQREPRDHGHNQNFAVLLQALSSQENNSAPSTPVTAGRPNAPHRIPSKHTRAVQSMSSLPSTPIGRGGHGLLPSVDLVPQTEPPYRQNRLVPETPPAGGSARRERRSSRESTISAGDNAELARQALQVASFASRGSQNSRSSRRQSQQQPEEEEVFESQASQAASEMLRRDGRESFEVASSVGNSRDGTPVPAAAEKSNKLQAKLFGSLNKSGVAAAEKRKFSSSGETRDDVSLRERLTSPTKKLRVAGGLRDPGRSVISSLYWSYGTASFCRNTLDCTSNFYPNNRPKTEPNSRVGVPSVLSRQHQQHRSKMTTTSLPKGLKAVLTKAPSDVVILSSLRTPVCRSYKGQLKDAYPEELLSVVLRATLDANPSLDPALIDDVAVGVVLSELGGSKAARMAMNHVGFPSTTSLYTVNRACSSSLQSITSVANQISAGMINVGIGAGMESMTRNYGSRAIPVDVWPALKESPVKDARDCIMPMGLTSENVAERYKVSRADQDAFAVESHRRAAAARAEGRFKDEIVPTTTRFQEVDKQGQKVGDEKTITVTEDDGIRTNATLEGLAKLKPAFKGDGASTAGNSSQVSDGAAATLLMRRSTATELGLTGSIIGKFVASAVVGCRPDEMGIGPALAIPKLLSQLGLENKDVDRWEINEAFASQAIHCVRELGLEKELAEGKVNPDGGAIALGHPLGATGARMVSTLMHGLGRTGGEVGVVSMCIGTGMGMGGLFVREH
ncbi:Thiolase, N-terminal domain-containing protein [Apodospora peruviana]|uniref:acetyl-CoA C-acyltransferase n=1 Tax=Apodospora peruviana TaxID=516989 RepID=A0AAE0M2P3_9PEZI|nr:Thiolase, N-terminal domain-containing protein [Apodospora peruviana]